MTGEEEQNELAVPAIKASTRLLLMGSPAHSSQQYFSLMSQVSLSGSCKLPTLSRSHYGSLFQRTFPVQLHLSIVTAALVSISSTSLGPILRASATMLEPYAIFTLYCPVFHAWWRISHMAGDIPTFPAAVHFSIAKIKDIQLPESVWPHKREELVKILLLKFQTQEQCGLGLTTSANITSLSLPASRCWWLPLSWK